MVKPHKIINRTFDKYVLDLVDIKDPIIRQRRYSNKYCLEMFKYMLKNVNSWKDLTLIGTYDYGGGDYHYKYLNQIFNKWVNLNIFNEAFVNMLNSNYFRLKHLKKNGNLNLFVDATFIINLYGVEGIGKNPEYRKKKFTKMSVVSDANKNIIGTFISETHLDANQKPAFRHDVKMVQKTLNNIGFDIPHNITTKIGGDKGYVTKKRFRLNNGKRSPIITRKKKNQIKKNTSNQKKILGKKVYS